MYNNIMSEPKRSTSMPLKYDPNKIIFASQGETTFYTDTASQMTSEQISEKIAEFEDNKEKYIDEILKKIKIIEERQGRQGIYYYFIGRLNPPHEGHIEALLNVIENAIENRGIAIILLGSGPKGERTSKDPLGFELKRDFVVAKLKDRLKEKYGEHFDVDRLFGPGGQVKIQEMGKPVFQIQAAVQDDMENLLDTLNKIYTFRVSGDKDGGEDLDKLKFIENGLIKANIKNSNGDIIEISTDVIPQKAVETEGQANSATQYRKDGWMGEKHFMEKHETFYTTTNRERNFAKEIFDEIDRYHPDKMVTSVLKVKRRPLSREHLDSNAGGSKRRKQTNRRKTKRRKCKRLTKRRKTKRRHYR
jgi:hypothetical protein